MSLKTEIQDTISNFIYDTAGLESLTADEDLDVAYRLTTSRGGSKPFEHEIGQGALVTVWIGHFTKDEDHLGANNYFFSTGEYDVLITGITSPFPTITEADLASSDLEEITRLHLQNLGFNITTSYGGGRQSQAVALLWDDSEFEVESWVGRQAGPVVDSPLASAGNSNHLTVTVDQDRAYQGVADSLYTVQVVTANTGPTSVAGLTYKFKTDNGSYSTPQAAGSGWNLLDQNTYVKFTPTGLASVGDTWTISAHVSQLNYLGAYKQMWTMKTTATAVQ